MSSLPFSDKPSPFSDRPSPFTDGDSTSGDRRAGVYVLDADVRRRRAAVGLLTARDDLCVLGAHPGSAAAVALVVRAVPHVCVVGPRVLAGPVPALVAELERVLPATRCVRVPSVIGVDPGTLSPAQRDRQLADAVRFVSSVLTASGRPARGVAAAVRLHFERWRPAPHPGVLSEVVISTVTAGWRSG